MSSLEKIMTNAASGMSAQSIRINTIASNLANADSVGPTEESTYRSKSPIFSEVTQAIPGLNEDDQPLGGVRVTSIAQNTKPLEHHHDPDNPLADADGNVYLTNVNTIEEMTNMISASKEYQANVEVMNTAKSLMMQTINVLTAKD
jgi:flagellar basal-body rod protein FlgC